MNKSLRPFHLAFPIYNIDATIKWYADILGCTIGRKDNRWVDFNFFGHQISGHLVLRNKSSSQTNEVDNKEIPVRHFGIILSWKDWNNLVNQLKNKKCVFIVEPYIRFKGKTGEQGTLFIKDPSDNILEFKSFRDDSKIFSR